MIAHLNELHISITIHPVQCCIEPITHLQVPEHPGEAIVPLKTEHVEDASFHLKQGTVRVKDASVHLRDGTFHVKQETFHLRQETFHVLEELFRLRDAPFHLRDASFHVQHGNELSGTNKVYPFSIYDRFFYRFECNKNRSPFDNLNIL